MKLIITTILILGIIWGFTHPRVESVKVKAYTVSNITPTVTPSPTPTISHGLIVNEITAVFEPEGAHVLKEALDIAFCESKWKHTAKNGTSTAEGVFQFIDSTWIRVRKIMGRSPDLKLKYNYKENIQTAKALYEHRLGRKLNPWTEWECYGL